MIIGYTELADGRVTVVSGKLGDDVRPGTWRAILKQTGLKEQKP